MFRVRRLRSRALVVCAVLLGASLPTPTAGAAVAVADDPAPGWGVDGRVYATVIVDDTVIVGGKFKNAVSSTGTLVRRNNLAAFSLATGELITSWKADAGAAVRALVSDGTSVWAGGSFGRLGGRVVSRLGKLSATTGAVDAGFTAGVDNTVRALALSGGSLYVGGTFANAGSAARVRLAKFDAVTGQLDPSFLADANNTVMGLAASPDGATLYVSGSFRQLSAQARNGVGAVSSDTGKAEGIVFASAARPTLGLAMDPDGSRLYGAGGSSSNAAAAWNTSTGTRVWRQVTDGDIQAVAYHSGTVYFGFHDGYQQDTSLKLLAANAVTGQLQTFYPRFNDFWGVFAIAVTDGGLVAGGEFGSVSGTPVGNFGRFLPLSSPRQEPRVVNYLGSTAVWSYNDGSVRPEGWQQRTFDASAWPTGLAQLGYGDGDETTVISSGSDLGIRNITAYFRTTFTISEVPDLLKLQLLADDGAVVYLNGVEVVRDNIPDGPVTGDTLALAAREGGPENALRPFSINPARLRLGENTLAVEVHQVSATSSDLGVDADLEGQFAE